MGSMRYNYHENNSATIIFRGSDSPKLCFKIDSGASRTIMPQRLFKHFKPHIDIKTGKPIELKSASGHTFFGYEHTIFVIFEGMHKTFIKVVFCEMEKYLLGLDTIRERFGGIAFGKNHFDITYI